MVSFAVTTATVLLPSTKFTTSPAVMFSLIAPLPATDQLTLLIVLTMSPIVAMSVAFEFGATAAVPLVLVIVVPLPTVMVLPALLVVQIPLPTFEWQHSK